MPSSPDDRVDTVVSLRPLGSPLGLGFVGLATATFVLSGFQLGWIAPDERILVGVVIVAFAVPLQIIASILSVLSRDTAAGTSSGTLAVTWLSIGAVYILSEPGSVSGALGLLLLGSGTVLVLSSGVVAHGKLVPALVLLLAGGHLIVDGIYELGAGAPWRHISGGSGLALAAVALYTAVAVELEDTRGRTVAPLGRRGLGRRSLEEPFADQVEGVEHEAGVRKTL